jgi:phosphatidylinositol alpha 1,6-mannosyltransferase
MAGSLDRRSLITGDVHAGHMRVAIVAESFLPRVNGVTNSVCRVVEQLARRGHQTLVVAPGPAPVTYRDQPVASVPSVGLPGRADFSVGLATRPRLVSVLQDFDPDVVHLASPTVLGAAGLASAARLALPTVAVFQTDLAAFAQRYRVWRALGDDVIWSWLRRIHDRADRNLAPSTTTMAQLRRRGFPRLARWGRGVDLDLFNPGRRSDELRAVLAPHGEVLVGYVGRLAPEKQVRRLAALHGMPGVRLVIVGNGPDEPVLRRLLPEAAFLGFRTGPDLAEAFASLDVFVHTGSSETFCQAVQEALASGVPVVAPASGGPVDLVDPGRTGYLIGPSDDQLRRAVRMLADDPEARALMGLAARDSVRSRSWSALTDELIGHYVDVRDSSAATLSR